MKQFTCLNDVKDPHALVDLRLSIKKNPYTPTIGKGKTIICFFLNPSLRTRLSTQKAANNLGMQDIILDVNNQSWTLEFDDGIVMNGTSAEHISEASKVISSYCDILAIRSFPKLQNYQDDKSEKILSQFLKHCTVPIISLESCLRHPLQSLTDIITIKEFDIKKPKIAVTWAPHCRALPQAVTNSFLEWSSILDVDVHLCHPEGYDLDPEFSQHAHTITHDQKNALENADFVYVKNWSQIKKYGQISDNHNDWIITHEKMATTKNGKLMHCLPVRRNVVISDQALDESIVIQQAANRVHAAQAVIQSILQR